MSLEVSITKGDTYTLKCDVIDHSFTRLVTQTGLPSGSEGSAPSENEIFLLDLGQCTETINLTGVVDDSPTDGSATRDSMENVVRSWWAYGDTVGNLLRISYPTATSQSYYGAIKNVSFRKTAGIPGRWEYSISFLIKSKV